jgi:predicted house-cleaning noncanonical NTP pyrophosphatase (MazG superfamily)
MSKLIRDRIPDVVRAKGTDLPTRIASRGELPKLLCDKLLEEAQEVIVAEDDDARLEELADLLEVVHAYASFLGKGPDDLDKVRETKRARCGGFVDGVVLIK